MKTGYNVYALYDCQLEAFMPGTLRTSLDDFSIVRDICNDLFEAKGITDEMRIQWLNTHRVYCIGVMTIDSMLPLSTTEPYEITSKIREIVGSKLGEKKVDFDEVLDE